MNLTPEQALLVAEIKQKWLNQMTVPINRERATAAIADIYRKANLEPPTYFFFCDSPLATVYLIYQHKINNSIIKGAPLQEKDKKKDLIVIAQNEILFYEWGQSWCGTYELAKMLGLNVDPQDYQLYYNYCWETQTVFLYEGACYVCDRPISYERIDADTFTNIKFKDGWIAGQTPAALDNTENSVNTEVKYELIKGLPELNLKSVLKPVESECLEVLRRSIFNQMGTEFQSLISSIYKQENL